MNEEDYTNPTSPSPSSFKQKLKQSLCFSCCFPRRSRHHLPLNSPPSDDNPAKTTRQDNPLSEIKEKCRSVLGINHKRHSSTEFQYDPLSYALNFEDAFEFDDEAPLKNFTARLPPSSTVPPAAAAAVN